MDDDLQRAWDYYQHADNLQHQRHNIFIVAQSILFATFVQECSKVGPVVAFVGITYALLWWWLSERLSDGMYGLAERYLKKSAPYIVYLDGLDTPTKVPRRIIPKCVIRRLSGRTVLNVIVPGLSLVAWVLILMRA